jgi:hypothetical protein
MSSPTLSESSTGRPTHELSPAKVSPYYLENKRDQVQAFNENLHQLESFNTPNDFLESLAVPDDLLPPEPWTPGSASGLSARRFLTEANNIAKYIHNLREHHLFLYLSFHDYI